MSDIKNKVIIITGGLGLLGLTLIEELAKDGAKVVVLDLKNSKILNKIKDYDLIKKIYSIFAAMFVKKKTCFKDTKKNNLKIKKN